ncbi:MAG TPA: OmpA family protein [Candidatus Paceibacterota bacterium]|nr:OmpA family protein [Candidatus Paceibacterota bacterium]
MKSTLFVKLMAVGLVLSMAGVGCRKKPVGVTEIPNQPIAHVPSTEMLPPIQPEFPPIEGGTNGPGSIGIPLADKPGHEGWNKDEKAFSANTVHFAFDSSALKTSEKSKVAAVADYLKSNPATAVEVAGHCDERGTEEYNRSLGERRALALREELVRLGIDPARVDTISYGEDQPANPAHNDTAWSENRRGEFILLSPPK